MKTRYKDLIKHSFKLPQKGFKTKGEQLFFEGIDLMEIVETYGTPLKFTYLPRISEQIQKSRNWFKKAFRDQSYNGSYKYCYCTKSSHFKFVLDEALKNNIQIEISSEFDIKLLRILFKEGKIDKSTLIVCNGFKPPSYCEAIASLINEGFNAIPILDNKDELPYYEKYVKGQCKIGIRVATEEEPLFEFYTSRMGMRFAEVEQYIEEKIKGNEKFELSMLHFFVDTGIQDKAYYWNELNKFVKLYCNLSQQYLSLNSINLGGGMPIMKSLGFKFDYQGMVSEIVKIIKASTNEFNIPDPDILTEFGAFTVGESGATIFKVIGQKQQNDSELWYMIDGSVINNLPDTLFLNDRFILLPLNKWKNEYTRINIGGITCDNSDYYNSETHINQVYLPRFDKDDNEPLYIGFFHTGAYQDALGGIGGIQHCLLPTPKHVLIDKDKNGKLVHWEHRAEQNAESMMEILGYK